MDGGSHLGTDRTETYRRRWLRAWLTDRDTRRTDGGTREFFTTKREADKASRQWRKQRRHPKRLIGDAAFAAFEYDLANQIEQDADRSNVVRLRSRR
jgi:hypothetical protein